MHHSLLLQLLLLEELASAAARTIVASNPPAAPGSFVGAAFDTAGRSQSSSAGLLQLNPTTAKITALAADPDTYGYLGAAFDAAAGAHYFSDGASVAKYEYASGNWSLGEDYLLDSRKCPAGEFCFGEFHWSAKRQGILAVALDWPTSGAAALVLVSPSNWSTGQFGTYWLRTTMVMPLSGVDSYIEGESEFDDATDTFFLTREVVAVANSSSSSSSSSVGGAGERKYAVHAFSLAQQTQRVLVPEYAPTPFVMLPAPYGRLLGFNANEADLQKGGSALVQVDLTTGKLYPFFSYPVRFAGLPADHTFAVDPSNGGKAVVTCFDLQMPASNPVLYNIDLLQRNVSAPRVLEHVVRYQRYFAGGDTV